MADLPEGFDLEALLAPIPGDAPQGVDLREDFSATSPYNRLRDARSEARDAERGQDSAAADQEVRDPAPFWRTVREVALTTLTGTTKDLEVAAWLTEALVRSHGLAGLTAGAQVMGGLAERYWDGLFPLPDEDGMETRVSPVTGLNGRDGNGSLMQPLYKLVLFVRRQDDTPVAFYQYQQAERLSTTAADRRTAFEILEKDARAADSRMYAALLADAWAARDAWQAMATVMDEKAGADGPSTTAVRDLLSAIIEVVRRYAPADAVAAVGAPDGEAAVGEAADAGAAASTGLTGLAVSPGQMASREDALRVLGEIANFFRRTEPHSPISYTLDEAVRRGRLTWPELLQEVVADINTRNGILNMLGIRPPPPEA
ncbi:MAG TPA: type VI secretion system protein TssA [Acetobacteraceae bacterium]|nr:type VI secretion system protein TssA [Acetobacteraceae bacterium]